MNINPLQNVLFRELRKALMTFVAHSVVQKQMQWKINMDYF